MKLAPWRNRSAEDMRTAFDKMFESFFEEEPFGDGRLPALVGTSIIPPVNVAENDKQWTVTCELPGMREKDISVETRGDNLVISGERRFEEESKKGEWLRVESRYGSFRRSIPMPRNARLEPDSVAATFKNGVLEVTVPKVEPTPSGKVPVKVS